MKIIYEAVLGVTTRQVKPIRDLANKVVKGIPENVAIYATPEPPIPGLSTAVVLLDKQIVIYESDKSPIKRLAMEKQARVVHKILKALTGYVSGVTSDKEEILLSGFDADKAPETHTIPKDKIVIKRIVDGEAANSAKIFIEKIPAGNHVDRYKVETSADGATWKLVLEIGSSKKLVVLNLQKAVELFYRVIGGNTHGFSKPSEAVPFSPR